MVYRYRIFDKTQSRPKGAPAKSSQIKCDSDGKLEYDRFFYTNNFVPGDYTFVAYVYGKDKYGNSYRERSEPFYVKMEKESSGNYLTVNGEMLSDPSRENSNFPYMVPGRCDETHLNIRFIRATLPLT